MKTFSKFLIMVLIVLALATGLYAATQSYTNNTTMDQIVYDNNGTPLTVHPGQTVTWTVPDNPVTYPGIGSLAAGKWCTSDGTLVNCLENAPTGSGVTLPSPVDATKFYNGAGAWSVPSGTPFTGGVVTGATTFQAQTTLEASGKVVFIPSTASQTALQTALTAGGTILLSVGTGTLSD